MWYAVKKKKKFLNKDGDDVKGDYLKRQLDNDDRQLLIGSNGFAGH